MAKNEGSNKGQGKKDRKPREVTPKECWVAKQAKDEAGNLVLILIRKMEDNGFEGAKKKTLLYGESGKKHRIVWVHPEVITPPDRAGWGDPAAPAEEAPEPEQGDDGDADDGGNEDDDL
jgi:hypothetical protein